MSEQMLTLVQALIVAECDAIKNLLLEKNASYGNSFAEPIRVFAKDLTPVQQIFVRIDDKLKRLANGHEYPGDDTVKDLIGYLVLLRVASRLEKEGEKT